MWKIGSPRRLARHLRASLTAPAPGDDAAARVREHWAREGSGWRRGGANHWTELRSVEHRINRRVSGEPLVDPYAWFLRTYLDGRLPVARALTLGCGVGDLERGLSQYGFCRRHDAFDIADASVKKAQEAARQAGLTHIRYEARDVNEVRLEAGAYDCVWGVHSIHHLAALEHVFAEVARALRPGGYFVLNEFVGPTQFQWTDRQLEVIDALLAVLPERLRRRASGSVKSRVERPTIAEMNRVDPSEAIRSAEILPLLPRFFTVVETRGYGGTVAQMLLHEIAGCFQDADEATAALLETVLDIEERLIALGDLPHDFAFVVCRKEPG